MKENDEYMNVELFKELIFDKEKREEWLKKRGEE
jgi:hypothetical protein